MSQTCKYLQNRLSTKHHIIFIPSFKQKPEIYMYDFYVKVWLYVEKHFNAMTILSYVITGPSLNVNFWYYRPSKVMRSHIFLEDI